jgi:outer membrane biosynthesis protein TonB
MAVDTAVTSRDEQHRKRGMMISVAIHVTLLMLALLPLLTFPDPPPGQEGILVNLGLPDEGSGDDNAGPTAEASEAVPDNPETEEVTPPQETVSEPEPEPEKEVITTDDSEVRLKKEKEKKKREEDRKRQEQLDKERKEREAREEAARKAAEAKAAKEREAQAFKDMLGGGGLSGDGDGKGNTGKPGNQGDPNGDPNSDILEGISTGSGKVGGGLGSRGVAKTHKPTDNSQDQGVVVVKVCVDRSGNVVSAKLTQAGTTATSARLKNLAISSAKQWKFSAGNVDRQCGTITYNFRAR